MSKANQAYALPVLETVVSQHLDERISVTAECLSTLEKNCDQVVWDVAQSIYSQSGQKVALKMIKALIGHRVRDLRQQLQAEEKHRAEQARLAAEAKVWEAIADAQREAEEKELRTKIESIKADFKGNEKKARYFLKIRKIICEQLSLEESEVTLESHLSQHPHVDELDLVSLVMALEAEFDIEIPEVESYTAFGIKSFFNKDAFLGFRTYTSLSKSNHSFSRNIKKKCVVKNLVETIYKASH